MTRKGTPQRGRLLLCELRRVPIEAVPASIPAAPLKHRGGARAAGAYCTTIVPTMRG